MKKILPLILFASTAFQALAQSASKFTGTWQGSLNVGIELRLVFHIRDDGAGGFTSTADSPDQSAYGLKCDKTTVDGDKLSISMDELSAAYSGKLVNDSTIDGTFTQGGASIPLLLKKTEKIIERNRPQTPKPPFPYRSEEVEYFNKDKSLRFGATVTIPNGAGPFPAAVLITGSGPQNRDEEIMEHKIFAVIADHLTRKGFMVLRADDRGVGKSTGNFEDATTADFAADAASHVDYLLTLPETDKNKIGLIGHSEGGMIAPMVAAERKDIHFIVLLAGPGVPIMDLMTEQSAAVLQSSGVSAKALAQYKPLYRQLVSVVVSNKDTTTAFIITKDKMRKWANEQKPEILKELKLQEAEDQIGFAELIVRSASTKWFRYFFEFDPAPYLKKLQCRVLALNGDKDVQVLASQNLPGIEKALKKSKANSIEIRSLPGLNHLFQTCSTCTVQEYGQLEETISPVALDAISSWLEKNVK